MPTTTNGSGSTGDFSAALKEFYGPGLIGSLNKDIAYFDALSEAGAEVELGGKGLVWPVHTKWSGGVGAIAEDATLPTAGTQSRSKATATSKEIYGRIELTRKVMASSRTNKMAFVDALDSEMDALESELKKQLNRQLLGNNAVPGGSSAAPNTGILTKITTGVANATQTVDTTHQLHSGMKLRIGTADHIPALASDEDADAAVIKSVDSRTQITLESSITTATGDLVTIGDANFTSFKHELFGLDHLIENDDDDLFGIDVGATGSAWKAHVDDNNDVNRSLSHERMDAMFDSVYERGGQRPNFVIGHNSFAREVKKLMEGDVRYEPQTYKGGFQRNLLVWNSGTQDVVIMSDHLCLPNRAYFLNLEFIKMAYLDRFDWLDEDGAVLSRISNKANFEAAFGAMLEQIVTKRNAHGVLKDISVNESTLVTPA
ncbi:MAG: hypothetical protein CMM54_00640 [Rhodospirillaceae bacterium]|nr:hypothetical protein [Rhodospirillaceae bacterium]MBI05468.1 hypothetical protein [Rhodospirillaceae bacterium]|tara:strand:+ start:3582 stop:4874 length:1293 start_codon:yes stop_codon:yes gene_type:complete